MNESDPCRDDHELEQRVDALETFQVDLCGKSGSNGKVGALAGRVALLEEAAKKADTRKWWALTFMAGLLVTVIGASIKFGRWMSEIETDVRWLKERRRPSISQPVDAGKETAQ